MNHDTVTFRMFKSYTSLSVTYGKLVVFYRHSGFLHHIKTDIQDTT